MKGIIQWVMGGKDVWILPQLCTSKTVNSDIL